MKNGLHAVSSLAGRGIDLEFRMCGSRCLRWSQGGTNPEGIQVLIAPHAMPAYDDR